MAEFTRRELLKAGGATAAVVGVGAFGMTGALADPAKPPAGAWNHNPASPIGPNHWVDIGFPACVLGTGGSQSPVNIATSSWPPMMARRSCCGMSRPSSAWRTPGTWSR